jgi:hypothetical protein
LMMADELKNTLAGLRKKPVPSVHKTN